MTYLSKSLFVLSAMFLPFAAVGQVVNAPATPNVVPPAASAQAPVAQAVPAPVPTTAAVPVTPSGQPMYTAVPVNVANNPAANFPILPPSRPCARQDADGLWQLKSVYENPVGVESSIFATQPYQYLLFSRDDTYRTYSTSWEERSDGVVMNRIREQIPEQLQQYVVHQSGVIFFYVGGAVKDTQVCFVVVTPNDNFSTGQMLLMPPEGTSKTRLVKVYQRSTTARSKARADDVPVEAIADSTKPRKKRRKRRKPSNR